MELPPLASAKPGDSLVEVIYVTLRDAIIRGELAAGSRLREIALSEHFGVSTTPVRSALAKLDFEGLVQISPRRGAVVASADASELEDLYELRELLECHAVRVAANAGDRQLSAVEDILAETEEILSEKDQARFNALDIVLHARLTALGGNTELLTLAQQTHRRIQAVRIRYAVALPDQPRASHGEHLAIFEALRAGDPDTAVARVREHISSVRRAVLEVVRSSQIASSAGIAPRGSSGE